MKKFNISLISGEKNRIIEELKRIGVDGYALNMWEKSAYFNILIKELEPAKANIIKQEALSIGGDAAVCKGSVSCQVENTDVLLFVNKKQLSNFIEKLKKQPFGLKDLANELANFVSSEKRRILARDKVINLSSPIIMGILNVTPDSFSDGGKYQREEEIVSRLEYFKDNNVLLVDIGGESTRPGAEPVMAEEEFKRIKFAVEKAVEMEFIVSVDTYKSFVAKKSLEIGAHIINDISGLRFDNDMADVCAEFNAAICMMHIKGTPKNMQNNPKYNFLLDEIKEYLQGSIDIALSKGIKNENIILDPGFGFGKTLEDNYLILKYLNEFKSLGYPLLVGISRKSMIGNVLQKPVNERLIGTKAAEMIALLNGADIIRTHDVKELNDMIKIYNFYKQVEFCA